MENARIVLIPRWPADLQPDLLFKTSRGFAVQATDAEIQAFKGKGIAVLVLFNSVNEYVTAMYSITRDQAVTLIESLQNQALAALESSDRDQFQVA